MDIMDLRDPIVGKGKEKEFLERLDRIFIRLGFHLYVKLAKLYRKI